MALRFLPRIPIGIKIYGLATSMLVLLAGVAVGNYQQMRKVNNEVLDLAEYITPVEKHIATVNVYALEQEIHFERILRLYEIEPLDMEQLTLELESFMRLGKLVNREIEQAIALLNEAASTSKIAEDLIIFARFEPVLQILEEDHQDFEDRALAILKLMEKGEEAEAFLLDTTLEEREQVFEKRIYDILVRLDRFTEYKARQVEAHEQKLLTFNLVLASIATLVGLTLAAIITIRLVQPVKELVKGAQAVEQGNLDTQVTVNSKDELDILTNSFNAMTNTIRQKEQLKEAFGYYVDPRIVETLIEHHGESKGSKQVMSVFFSDLAKFSTISEMLTPVRLVNLINQYLTLATEPITQSDGVIDKFIGDAIVAFWGPPFVSETEHAKLACYAALDQLIQLQKLQRLLPDIVGIRKGLPKVSVRVGLDTGELVVGNVGTEHLQSYTVMGHAVEIAEQLETANKRYGTQILLTERTRQLAGEAIETREIDLLPTGKDDALVPVYELLGYGGDLDPMTAQLRDIFESGLYDYREQNWEKARANFETCLRLKADDGPSKFYLQQLGQNRHGSN